MVFTDEKTPLRLRLALALAIVVLTVAFLMPGGLLWRDLAGFLAWGDAHGPMLGDFVIVWQPTGEIFRSHREPSPGFFYTGFFATCLWFFVKTIGKIGLAWHAWLVGQILAAVLAWAIVATDFRLWRRPVWLALWTSLFALSYPLLHNLRWGQVSTPLLALSLLALHLGRRGGWAGPVGAFALALASAIKFYPAIYAIGPFLRGRFRFVIGAAATTIFLLIVPPSLILGPAGLIEYHRQIAAMIAGAAWWVKLDPNSSYFASWAIWRFVYTGPTADAVRPLLVAVGVLVFLGQLALCWMVRRRSAFESDYWCFVLISLGLPFVVGTSWPHYFVFLPVCIVFLARELHRTVYTTAERRWLAGLFLIPAALLLLAPVRTVLPVLYGEWTPLSVTEVYRTLGVLMFANILLMTLAGLLLLRQSKLRSE